MTSYVALLRGINVGKAKRVAMATLREMAASLGYTDVATHLNSGNLLLTTDEDADTVRRRVEQAVQETFGLHADVVVRTADQLAEVLAANPFPDGDPSQVTIAFLSEPAPPGLGERMAVLATEDEPFLVRDLEVYVHYGHGQGESKLAASSLGVSATVRNLRTVTKLVELTRPPA
jgi:uncharacterized protein (DUF1697 family)